MDLSFLKAFLRFGVYLEISKKEEMCRLKVIWDIAKDDMLHCIGGKTEKLKKNVRSFINT